MSHDTEGKASQQQGQASPSSMMQDEFHPETRVNQSKLRQINLSREATHDSEHVGEPIDSVPTRTGLDPYTRVDNEPSSTELYSLRDQEPLDNVIRKSMVKSVIQPGSKFLPADKLIEIITFHNVVKELNRSGFREMKLDSSSTAHKILGDESSTVQTVTNSRSRIFAVLALMQESAKITQFINKNIYDHHLPLMFTDNLKGGFHCSSTNGDLISIDFLQKPSHCDSFKQYQWELQAPFFELSFENEQIVQHYDLDPRSILPFTEDEIKDDDISSSLAQEGGQAVVRRVMIHPAHHNYEPKPASEKIYFAVKQYRIDEETNKARGRGSQKEALALKRFDDHKHLIRLLTTYTYHGHFHMVFPWASGNLKEFWSRDYRDPSAIRQEGHLAKWMSIQCLGLARALQSIHKSDIAETNVQKLPLHFRGQSHGRHGDLKPENILWFKNNTAEHVYDRIGILKISDFGFADFHGPFSHSNVGVSSVGYTDTYKAPEYDVRNQVSQKYDMWSLGCVLLQFFMWYIHGWEEVDRFSERRTKDSNFIIPEDRFFNFYVNSSSSKGHILRASLKESVVKDFRSLREHAACSDFVWDMLEIIQSNLLRMNPNNRASCELIVQKLQRISNDCLQDQQYCTMQRRKRVSRADTQLSELVSFEFSAEMKKRTIDNIRPSGPSSFISDPQQGSLDVSSIQGTPPGLTSEFPGLTHQAPSEPETSGYREGDNLAPQQNDGAIQSTSSSGARQRKPALKRGLRWLVDLFQRCMHPK